jgi:hypothetical protein
MHISKQIKIHKPGLCFRVFDTTLVTEEKGLAALLKENGHTVRVVSIHTAGGASFSAQTGPISYHWVTVIYENFEVRQ